MLIVDLEIPKIASLRLIDALAALSNEITILFVGKTQATTLHGIIEHAKQKGASIRLSNKTQSLIGTNYPSINVAFDQHLIRGIS